MARFCSTQPPVDVPATWAFSMPSLSRTVPGTQVNSLPVSTRNLEMAAPRERSATFSILPPVEKVPTSQKFARAGRFGKRFLCERRGRSHPAACVSTR